MRETPLSKGPIMQFIGLSGNFGTATFDTVVYPMPELSNEKLVRKARRQIRVPRTPKPLLQTLKNFLLTYDK